MKLFYFIFSILLSFSLVACNQELTNETDKVQPIQTKAGNEIMQSSANQAKEMIGEIDEVKEYRAVDLNRDLYVAVELKHRNKFQTEKILKDIKKKLNKKMPDKQIRVTPDHKIFIELDRLEQRIKTNSVTKNELNKELEKLNKLFEDMN